MIKKERESYDGWAESGRSTASHSMPRCRRPTRIGFSQSSISFTRPSRWSTLRMRFKNSLCSLHLIWLFVHWPENDISMKWFNTHNISHCLSSRNTRIDYNFLYRNLNIYCVSPTKKSPSGGTICKEIMM